MSDLTLMPQNVLSMRGPWRLQSEADIWSKNAGGAFFDTWSQSLKFPASAAPIKLINSSGRNVSKVLWSQLAGGDNVRFVVEAKGGAKVQMEFWSWSQARGNHIVFDTTLLGDGE